MKREELLQVRETYFLLMTNDTMEGDARLPGNAGRGIRAFTTGDSISFFSHGRQP